MMLLERWAVAAILGFGLVSTAGAPGQSQAPKPADAQTDAEPADEPAHYVPAPLPPDPAAPAAPASADPASADPAPAPAAPAQASAPAPVAPAPASVAPTPVAAPAARISSADPAQQQLEKDSEHLLQLVQALKLEVEKAGSNTLSLAALRKADEIQRLAKSLKERMREREQVPAGKP